MPTVTFSIAANADDGTGYIRDDTHSWPPAGSNWVDDPNTILYAARGWTGGSNYTYTNNVFLRWDTSSIGGGTVSAAELRIFVPGVGSANPNTALMGDYYDFGGEPTVFADYKSFTTGDTSIFTPVSPADSNSFPTATYYVLPLTSLSGINTTGYTGIRLGISITVAPTGGENFAVQAAAHDGGSNFAQLGVTYTAGTSVLVSRHALGAGRW